MKVSAQEVTKTVYLYISNATEVVGLPHFVLHDNTEMEQHGWLLVGSKEFEFDIPAIDTAGGAIDLLKQQKSKVLSEAQSRVSRIDDQIQSLLAIGCDSE